MLFRIKSACNDVTDFAIENYRNAEVSLSCILFTELAGKDSLPLRASLIAANILHENMTRNLSTEQDFEKSFPEICKLFLFLLDFQQVCYKRKHFYSNFIH